MAVRAVKIVPPRAASPGAGPAEVAASRAATADPVARPNDPRGRHGELARPTQQFGKPSSELLALFCVVVLAALVGLMFHRVFGISQVLVPTVIAAVVPAALVAVLHHGVRAPAAVSVTVSTVTAVVVGNIAYARDRTLPTVVPTPASLGEVSGALADAPREILTTVLPATPTQGSLVLVPACVWAASAAGAELIARTRSVALPVLPATVLLPGAVLLATGAPGTSLPIVAAFAVAAGLLLAFRGPTRHRRHTALAALLALLLAAGGAFAAPRLPGASRHAFDPRGHVDPPAPTTVRGPSPLAYVSAWLQHPETPLFTDAGAPPPPGGTLYRLAAFDHYDGVAWAPVDRFVPSGGRVPAPERGRAPDGAAIVQDITIGELPGVFLPAADRPVEVDVPEGRFAVDPDSGVLASDEPLRTGTRYRVTSRPIGQDPRRTEYAAAGHTAAALTLPDRDASGAVMPVLEELRRYAQEATAGAGFPYQQALRLAAWLRGHAVADPQAIPGHSYRHIQYFLDTSRQGTSEQFATAFALMARTLALPARVVVGFRATAGDEARPVTQVRGGDVLVWAEVEFDGVGWVPFFPTPGFGTATSAVAPPTEEVPEPEAVPAGPAPPSAAGPAGPPSRDDIDRSIEGGEHASAAASARRGSDGHGLGAVETALAVSGMVVIGYAVFAFAGPAWVRRSRRRGNPAARIAGAWAQVVDDLARTGPPMAPGATSGDAVQYARRHVGGVAAMSVATVAEAVDGAAFGDVDASQALADECARHVGMLRAEVRDVLTRDRRARAADLARRLSPHAVARSLTAARGAARLRQSAGSA